MNEPSESASRWTPSEIAAWLWLVAQRDVIGGWVGFDADPRGGGLLSPKACQEAAAACEALYKRGLLDCRRDPPLGPCLFYRALLEHELDITRSMAKQLLDQVACAPLPEPPCVWRCNDGWIDESYVAAGGAIVSTGRDCPSCRPALARLDTTESES